MSMVVKSTGASPALKTQPSPRVSSNGSVANGDGSVNGAVTVGWRSANGRAAPLRPFGLVSAEVQRQRESLQSFTDMQRDVEEQLFQSRARLSSVLEEGEVLVAQGRALSDMARVLSHSVELDKVAARNAAADDADDATPSVSVLKERIRATSATMEQISSRLQGSTATAAASAAVKSAAHAAAAGVSPSVVQSVRDGVDSSGGLQSFIDAKMSSILSSTTRVLQSFDDGDNGVGGGGGGGGSAGRSGAPLPGSSSMRDMTVEDMLLTSHLFSSGGAGAGAGAGAAGSGVGNGVGGRGSVYVNGGSSMLSASPGAGSGAGASQGTSPASPGAPRVSVASLIFSEGMSAGMATLTAPAGGGGANGGGSGGNAGRSSASTAEVPTKCVECDDAPPTRRCHECSECFCDACFGLIHRRGVRQSHLWTPVQPPLPGHISEEAKIKAALRGRREAKSGGNRRTLFFVALSSFFSRSFLVPFSLVVVLLSAPTPLFLLHPSASPRLPSPRLASRPASLVHARACLVSCDGAARASSATPALESAPVMVFRKMSGRPNAGDEGSERGSQVSAARASIKSSDLLKISSTADVGGALTELKFRAVHEASSTKRAKKAASNVKLNTASERAFRRQSVAQERLGLPLLETLDLAMPETQRRGPTARFTVLSPDGSLVVSTERQDRSESRDVLAATAVLADANTPEAKLRKRVIMLRQLGAVERHLSRKPDRAAVAADRGQHTLSSFLFPKQLV
jgi:hypothetical protein